MVVSLLERVAVPVTPIKSMLKPSGSPILNTQQKSARDAKIICQTEKENVARLQSIQIAGDSAEIPKHAPVQADTPKEMQGDTPTGVSIDTLFPTVTVSHDYYRISKPLFEGANGIIVKGAHKERKNDVVIIKIIKNSTDCCAERLRRSILNEFSVIRRCSHKNVVTVLDIAKLEVKDDQTANSSTDIMAMAHQPESLNGIAIVFPFYKHGDLLGFLCSLRRSHVEINASLKDSVFKQILKGVTYLHQNGIVHRDLKPENCLIDAQGVVKIADFSFSVVVSDEAAMRELNEVPEEVYVGTSSFKAPELFAYEHYINMAKGEGDSASEICNCISNITGKQPQITAEHLYRLDYWSLGVVYLNICTMQSPWNNANAYDSANFKYTDFEKNYPKTSTDLSRMVNDLNNNKITSFRNNPALNLFKSIHYDSRKHIIGLLNPQAKDRLTVQQVLDSPWISQVYANTRDLIALVEKKAR